MKLIIECNSSSLSNLTTVDADTENTSSAQNLVIRILRDLIDEKLDWTKPWNHQNAITIAEIFTKVQEQYKNITGGTPISVDLLNTAGVTYFRNKKVSYFLLLVVQ